MKKWLLVVCSVFSMSVFSGTIEYFMPQNDFKIPESQMSSTGLSKAQFNSVIDKIEKIYAPIIGQMSGNLVVNRLWSDATVNASASRESGDWEVNMYGGLARHPAITEDGFAIVLCHEIGHHIGGAPKKASVFDDSVWASNEGQSDYWSTLKCLRKVFLNDDNSKIVASLQASPFLVSACSKNIMNKEDRAVCVRSGMAGLSVAKLFSDLSSGPEAKFETPDPKVVRKTDDSHPAYQCRLDTFLQGALCEKSFNEDVSQQDEITGVCHIRTGQTVGLRPKCWFKSKK